ncbi:MAG: Nicotinate phosphoribosyltransferase 2 [Firmicutes bacterium ADurb.Bin354]|nr:MAG: Nicotinate phosphoribosyltransferase 2 [Firmicutes bacterium ADurb.Bin354]
MKEQIITSLLDNDLYKFNMGQCLLHQYADANVVWQFKNRDAETRKFTPEMVQEIKEQVRAFCDLRFKKEELDYLKKACPWLSVDYISFLSIYHPQYDWFEISLDENSQLYLTVSGPQFLTTYCETPVMSIISETWFRMELSRDEYAAAEEELYKRTDEKIAKLTAGEWELGAFSDFGTRRRFSKKTFDVIIEKFTKANKGFKNSFFVGTSNVELAMKYGIRPVGTIAHEMIQTIGQGYPERNPAYSNKFVMDAWHKEYGTENGTYLTDCIGTDVFLKDFDKVNAKLFDGVRHDSGDPYEWGEKMIKHYESLGINTHEKTLLFSDSLNFDKAHSIRSAFKDRAKVAFGIGTYIVADTNVKYMNQVLKVVEVNGRPVAKLSDVEGKNMCRDPKYIDYLKRSIKWRMEH